MKICFFDEVRGIHGAALKKVILVMSFSKEMIQTLVNCFTIRAANVTQVS